MSRYELVDVNNLTFHISTSFSLIQQVRIGLLCLRIARQQEYLACQFIWHTAKVLLVPEKDIEHFVGQLGVKAHSFKRSHLLLTRCLNAVFVIEVVESSILKFSHVP